jgi:transposase, IS5 family
MSDFQWQLPCDPSDLVYFRQRIREQGVALILGVSAQMHGERAKESEVVVDSTVQEKNVTYRWTPLRALAGRRVCKT